MRKIINSMTLCVAALVLFISKSWSQDPVTIKHEFRMSNSFSGQIYQYPELTSPPSQNAYNVTIGPISGTQAQITTTATSHFLFNKDLRVSTGGVGSASGNLSLKTGASTRMTLSSTNGFVGIGTTAPSNALHIHGLGSTGYTCSPAPCMNPTQGYLQITNAFSGASQADGLKIGLFDTEAEIGTTDMTLLRIFNQGSKILMYPDGKIEFGEPGKFVVKSNGQVGVGTVSPASGYILDIAGKVRSCEVKVAQTSWCDFVFAPEYPLMSLSNLKDFIQENRHLPEMPSEAEVLENDGFEVSKMTQALLQRAEENTLYIIALEEMNAELQNKLSEQYENFEAKIAALERKLEEVLSKQ